MTRRAKGNARTGSSGGILAWLMLLACAAGGEAQRTPVHAVRVVEASPGLPETLETAPRPPAWLGAGERVAVVRAGGFDVRGVQKELRLTPAAPYSPNGRLIVHGGLVVQPDETGGYAILRPAMVSGSRDVTVVFDVADTAWPVLVDFVVHVAEFGTMDVWVLVGGAMEKRTLFPGPHHVTTLVLPKKAGVYTAALRVAQTSEFRSLTVYAVEITVLQ